MKKKISLLLFTLLTTFGCKECTPEQICQSTYLADLTLNAFKSTFDYIDDGKEYYSIAHTIINFIGDINGCESNAQTASPSQFLQRITYSANPNFTNAIPVDETPFSLNSLSPGISGNINDQLAFLQDGYYLFHSIADYTGVITERNEDNNEDDNPLDRSSTTTLSGNVIHVTNASKNPVYDSNGNRVFYQRISTTIFYE